MGARDGWPRSALERARLVTELRAKRYTLDEIVEIVGERLGLVENDATPEEGGPSDKVGSPPKQPRRSPG